MKLIRMQGAVIGLIRSARRMILPLRNVTNVLWGKLSRNWGGFAFTIAHRRASRRRQSFFERDDQDKMIPQPPPGQGPIDPRGAFAPPPPPGMTGAAAAPSQQSSTPPPSQSSPSAPGQYPAPYPPGMYPPPMMMPPPGFFKPQRSFARVIFTTLASLIFGLSLTLNLYTFFFAGIGSSFGLSNSQEITQTVLIEGATNEKIAVIPIDGVIVDGTAERFSQIISAVEKDPNVKAIVINIDTPGGSVTPSDEINARITRFRKQNPKRPVIIAMGGMATSGGYYISCAADYIFAQPTTLTGNIGVILPRVNLSKLAKSYGVEESTLTSPPDGFKNAGSMLQPVTEKDNKYWQALIDNAYARFKTVVSDGRKGKLTGKIENIADGEVYPADKALALGLVDEVGYKSDAYDKAARLANLTNKHVVKYSKPQGIFDLLGGLEGKSNLPSGQANSNVTLNGINLNIDAKSLDELSRPRLMYLWRGQ